MVSEQISKSCHKKWTQACDRRLARLISYIHHTYDYRQYCHVGNTTQHCRSGLFQGSHFAGDLQDSKSTSVRILCIFGSRTFVPIRWVCKKQTLVSHSSTDSEVVSLDAGLRMDGLPALRLWDVVIQGLHSFKNTESTQEAKENLLRNSNPKPKRGGNRDVDELSDLDHVVTNASSFQGESPLFIFEDSETVINMIIKGRSPTMRNVSRTHRVALDWLFDRINLDT